MALKEISFKEYTKLFYSSIPDNFAYQESPVQLYKLSAISKYLVTPTPLLKAQFSFLIHLTAGCFIQEVGGEIKEMFAGSVLLVAHGETTSLLSRSQDVEGYFVLFENKVFNELFTKDEFLKLFIANPVILLNEKDNRWITKLNQLLIEEVKETKADSPITIYLFSAVLHKILAASKLRRDFSKQHEIAIKFRQLAYQYFETERTVSFYARKLNISENYLNRSLKEVLGKSSKTLLLEVAVIQSQLYLHDFTKNIADISYSLNFADPSYFGRLFKKIIGISPMEYRKKIMHDLSE